MKTINVKRIKHKKGTKKEKGNSKYIIFFVVAIFLLNIGFAASMSSVEITGSAKALKRAELYIDSVVMVDSNNANENAIPLVSGTSVTSNVTMGSDGYAYITYEVTIANGTDSIQKYTGTTYNPDTATQNAITYEVTGGLDPNHYLFPGEETTFTLTYKYRSGAASGDYTLPISFDFNDAGKFNAISYTSSVDLTNVNSAPIRIKVMNNNDTAQTYTLAISNDKFDLTDENGNPLQSRQIAANTSEEVTAYITKKQSVIYYKTSYETEFELVNNGNTFDFGTIGITTNITPGYEDTTPPQIGPVSIDINYTVGTFDITWTNLDTGNASPVNNYFIKLYTSDGTLIGTYETGNDDTTYRFTNMSPATYYVQVYGIDEAENSGESSCSSASNTTTDCRRSDDTEIRWVRTITYNISNNATATASGGGIAPTQANLGDSLTITIRANNNYEFTTNPTVYIDGSVAPSDLWSYSGTTLTINTVTDDIEIRAATQRSSCLVKGTRILLADGTYKNIEDIRYDDLLQVWNYETGKITYEYPIWIEKSYKASSYEKTTFSDGTVLKTVELHQVFSLDDNKFVNILDNDEYIKIGTNVAKVVNGSIVPVSVVSVETINEEVEYYYVASSIYYNIISEDLITTSDQITTGVTLSNMYGFDSNIKWPSVRKSIINAPGALYTYEDLNIMPYYLYYGSRGAETKLFVNLGFATTPALLEYLRTTQLNPDKAVPPIMDSDGNRLWMVTTSDDNVVNKSDYLYHEGDIYTLKVPKNVESKTFIGWYNTIDEKIYNIGDNYKVIHGTHFIAIWE